MQERLLDKHEIAARFNTGWRKARSLLAKMGVMPIDVGEGKKARLRWLESAVNAAIFAMHAKAQPKVNRVPLSGQNPDLKLRLVDMSASSVYEYIAKGNQVQ